MQGPPAWADEANIGPDHAEIQDVYCCGFIGVLTALVISEELGSGLWESDVARHGPNDAASFIF